MFFWSKFPFVRVAIFLIAGILLGVYFPDFHLSFEIFLIISVAFFMVIAYRTKTWLIKLNFLYGLALASIFMSLGYLFLTESTETNEQNHIINQARIDCMVATVISEPQQKGDFLRMRLDVSAIKDTIWRHASGKLLAYFKQPRTTIAYGDKLLICHSPLKVTPPLNPHEFDYQQYLAFNNIYHQIFIDNEQFGILEKASGLSLIRMSIITRDYLEKTLTKFISGPRELAIAKALILGNKMDLDKPTREVYAMAGAMHVLAVSGLHVGIIYMILLLALGQGRKNVKNPTLVAAVVIPALWIYAFITGLSPSVLRAVTMFSFLALAQMFNRKSDTFNTLAISAILLLLINPYIIMSVGFQLSYIAVIGIIFWYPIFENLLNPSNKVIRLFWQITALSMAAQLATSPLSALYFHRFPTYFFVSNLLVIPAATLIVWGGLALLSFGSISSGIGILLGSGLQILIKNLNLALQWISALPFADIHNLAPSILDSWVLYAIIILLFLYLSTRKLFHLRMLMAMSIVFLGSLIFNEYRNRESKQMVFYSVSSSWAVDFIEDKTYSVLADSTLLKDYDKVDFLVTPNRRFYGLKPGNLSIISMQIPELGEVVVWHKKIILLANPCIQVKEIPAYFDIVLYKTERTIKKCYQEQILLRKFVNNQASYVPYNLRVSGALIVDI